MKETNPYELFNAWLALPDLQRGNEKMQRENACLSSP
jgi:hypothetical protein